MSRQSTTAAAATRGGFLTRGQRFADGPEDASLAAGNSPLPPQLALGPSVVYDDEGNGGDGAAASIPASQLFSQAGGARLARQRPRFHTVQDLDLALNQAIEGRITSKNAWVSKEASDLLEGITHTIESTLDANTADDYSGFTKAATVVEGCSKVWTVRVDSTYQQSNQMVQRLLRNEDTSVDGAGGGAGDGTGEEEDEEARRNRRCNQRAAAAAAAAAAARTLALNASEINLDSKAKTALTQTGINAQFRAITEKFDQGNAQGLLLNNAPLGGLGNVILDVDYARVEGQFSAKKARQLRQQQEDEDALALMDEGEDGSAGRVTGSAKDGGSPRLSLHCVERDLDINMTLDDLPDLTPTLLDGETGQLNTTDRKSTTSSAHASARASTVIDNLLVLPHDVMKRELAAEGSSHRPSLERPSTSHDQHGTTHAAAGYGGDGGASGLASVARGEEEAGVGYEDDNDFGGGDWDDAYDNNGSGGEEEDGGDGHAYSSSGRDMGQEARLLVTGLAEMAAMDAYFGSRRGGSGGETHEGDNVEEEESGGGGGDMVGGSLSLPLAGAQLALEAEDPSSWCPLTDASTSPLAGMAPNSELSRLRKRHHVISSQLTQTQQQQQQARLGSGAGALSAGAAAAGQPPAKRGKKERTVVFDLSEVEGLTSGGGASSAATTASLLHLSKTDVDGSALKQSTTVTKNVTPLGREVLLGKDAQRAVLAYTQSAVQRAKAEQANLVMPADPVPGETVPSYLAFPITIDGFFQPFSTTQSSWNMLRKSASGRLLDSQQGRPSGIGKQSTLSNRLMGEGGNGEDGNHGDDNNMPVAFFAGGAETDDMGGNEYDDANDFYGGGGAGSEDGDDANAEEEEYRRAELQLLRQFDAQQQQQQLGHGTAAEMASALSSAIASARNSGQLLSTLDPQELVRMLQSPEAILPTQVDVVKLRATMWSILQELAGIATGAKGREAGREGDEDGTGSDDDEGEEDETGRAPTPPLRSKESMLKPALLRVLAKKAGKEKATRGKEEAHHLAVQRSTKRSREDDGGGAEDKDESSSTTEEEEDGEEEVPPRENTAKAGALTFSDVVEAMLPQIPLISSTGTLSPAFFFFSLLFLANEHSIVLENVKALDDLVIEEASLIHGGGGGTIHRRTSPKCRKIAKNQTATRA